MAAGAGSQAKIRPIGRYLTIGALVFLLLVLFSTLVMPWWMGMRGAVPQEIYLQTLPDVNGAYLLTDKGVLPLFTWYMPLQEMPADAPTLNSDQIESFVIIQAQHFPPEQYALLEMNHEQVINWQEAKQHGKKFTLFPENLPPGDYMLIQPTTSMYGEDHFFYFRIQ